MLPEDRVSLEGTWYFTVLFWLLWGQSCASSDIWSTLTVSEQTRRCFLCGRHSSCSYWSWEINSCRSAPTWKLVYVVWGAFGFCSQALSALCVEQKETNSAIPDSFVLHLLALKVWRCDLQWLLTTTVGDGGSWQRLPLSHDLSSRVLLVTLKSLSRGPQRVAVCAQSTLPMR